MSQNRFAFLGEIVSRRPVLIACLSGLAAALLAAGYLNQREREIMRVAEPVGVIAASRDVAAGEAIDEGMARTVKVPRRFVQPGAIAAMEDAAGRIAAVPIRAGAQITAANARRPSELRSVAGLIPAGRRAFAISSDDSSGIAGLVKPNDMVDVMATFDLGHESSVRRTTMTIVENVQVLAVGSEVADALPAPPEKSKGRLFGGAPVAQMGSQRASVTLAASPAEAQVLAFAQASGALAIALRPFGDDAGAEKTSPTTIATITGGHDELMPMKRGYREYRGR